MPAHWKVPAAFCDPQVRPTRPNRVASRRAIVIEPAVLLFTSVFYSQLDLPHCLSRPSISLFREHAGEERSVLGILVACTSHGVVYILEKLLRQASVDKSLRTFPLLKFPIISYQYNRFFWVLSFIIFISCLRQKNLEAVE